MGIISRLGHWLDTRFPEKVVVTSVDFKAMGVTLDACRVDSKRLDAAIQDIKSLAIALDLQQERLDNLIAKQELIDKKSLMTQIGR